MGGLRSDVARRRGEAVERSAEALIEAQVGAAGRQGSRNRFPANRGLAGEIRVREKAVDRHRLEALVGMEDEHGDVASKERCERRGPFALAGSRPGDGECTHEGQQHVRAGRGARAEYARSGLRRCGPRPGRQRAGDEPPAREHVANLVRLAPCAEARRGG